MNLNKNDEKLQQGFRRLEQNIVDVIKESQIKLGYAYSSMQLYYPLESLNHTLKTSYDTEEMCVCLNEFADYTKDRLGKVECSNSKKQFYLNISPDGVKYVNEHVETSAFLIDLIRVTGRHGCTREDIMEVFREASDKVIFQEINNGEFDYLIYFEDENPDDYRYCFHQEGEHTIYHRFRKEDYEDFDF